MTTAQYLAALKKLGLTPAGKATALAFGLSVRQIQNIAAGKANVSGPLARLIELMLRDKPE